MSSEVFLTALAMACSVPIIMLGIVLFAKHLSRRQLTQGALQTEELLRRLERIEQAVETSAVEIERFAESNRFIVKLLSERGQEGRVEASDSATRLRYPSHSG